MIQASRESGYRIGEPDAYSPSALSSSAASLRMPRRAAGLRLTVLYGAAFLACGAAVLALPTCSDGGTVPLAG